jgi:cysteinyl-tRNA synthetase
MTIRFFILQAHYRSTVDFSNEALSAAEKGLQKLLAAEKTLLKIKPAQKSTVEVALISNNCHEALCDDLNSPIVLAHLFEAVRIINSAADGSESMTAQAIDDMKSLFKTFVHDILGLHDEATGSGDEKLTAGLMKIIINLRQEAKNRKEWELSDRIRSELKAAGITLKDVRDGAEWERDY